MSVFTPWRVIGILLTLLVIGIPLLAVGFFVLAIAGSPGSCEVEGRPISPTQQDTDSFIMKWEQLNNALDAGQPSTATFTESEVTGRARLWVEENDLSVTDLYICFSAGEGGQASGKIDVPFFPGDVDVLVSGSVELTGDHPEATIDELEVGGLPGIFTNLVEGFINALIDDQEDMIELTHDYSASYGDGTVTISGQP
jgi:hypothetical protein